MGIAGRLHATERVVTRGRCMSRFRVTADIPSRGTTGVAAITGTEVATPRFTGTSLAVAGSATRRTVECCP